jgi:hypothetical protein
MIDEQRLSNLEAWKEQFIKVTDSLMLDSKTKQDTIDLLMKEVFQLKATVQVLSDELATLKRPT